MPTRILPSTPSARAAVGFLRLLTQADKWIIGTAVLAGVLLWVFLLIGRSDGSEVLIEARGRLYARSRLSAASRFDVPGPLGITVVEVKGGAARILSSPCPEKVCVHRGAIHRSGSMIVCVPNRVIVRIAGGSAESLDLITE